MHWIIEPGFFSSEPVRVALWIGALIAVVSAVVGIFTVIHGQSFGGHALTDVSTAGGSGALLIGVTPLAGFVAGGMLGAGVMEAIGIAGHADGTSQPESCSARRRASPRCSSISTRRPRATTGASQQILFGSIFVLQSSTIPYVIAFAGGALGLTALLYRPLLLSSVSDDIGAPGGVPVRTIGVLYMFALAISVGLSSLVIGTILSTALLIGPPAVALRITKRMSAAIALSVVVGIASTWLGILLAYDSYYWGSAQNGWPVSFFIVAIVFVTYLASGLPRAFSRKGRAHEELALPDLVVDHLDV